MADLEAALAKNKKAKTIVPVKVEPPVISREGVVDLKFN